MENKYDLTDLLRWNQDEEAVLKNNLDFLKCLNIEWFKNVFMMYLGKTPLLGHPIGGRVIRARLNETDNFYKPSQLSYNSEYKDRIKTGRFNREKQPMFYGTIQNGRSLSHAVFTSCLESFPEIIIGDGIDSFLDFTVGTWKVVSEFYVIDLTYDKIKSQSIELGVDQALDKIKSTAEGKILDILFDFWDFVSNICSAKSKSELDYLLTNILLDELCVKPN